MDIPPRYIINPHIYLFIYNLLKNIFNKDDNNESDDNFKKKRRNKINLFIGIANEKIYQRIYKNKKNEEKKITEEYSKKNFENIILFLEKQNPVYIGDILNNILIQICGFAMQIEPFETINENIFDNLKANSNDLEKSINFINVGIFKSKAMKDNLSPPFRKPVYSNFLYILFYSYKKKFDIINNKKEFNDFKIMKYIFNYYMDGVNNYFIDDLSKTVNNFLSNELTTKKSSMFFNIHCIKKYLAEEFDIVNKCQEENENEVQSIQLQSSINMTRYFFFTLFVYYKMITDSSMKYSRSNNNEKNKIINTPFTYDIEYGFMNVIYALMITSPIKIIKNIKNVSFRQNNLADIGLFEIGNALLFNKEIELLIYDKNLLRSYYFAYFTYVQRIFENYNIKEITFNNNIYIREDIDIILCEIIKHFKGLRVLSIANNELKSGIKNFCIELKKLYRVNKCQIEELNFNKCALNEESIYELSELLKCKKCKLKSLNLNKNNLKDIPKIFKGISKNKSLVQLYVNKCQINNNMVNKINKIISLHENLEIMDVSKNCIKSSNQLIRLISRSKIIKDNVNPVVEIKITNNHAHLYFLDISQNPLDYLQNKFIENIEDMIPIVNLKILDTSKTILEANPNLYERNIKKNQKDNNDYYKNVKDGFAPFVEKHNKKNIFLNKEIYSLNNNINEIQNLLKKNGYNEEKNNNDGENEKLMENNNKININDGDEKEDEKKNENEVLKNIPKVTSNLDKSRKIVNNLEKQSKQNFYLIV